MKIRLDHRKSYWTIGQTIKAQFRPPKPHHLTTKNTIGHQSTIENQTMNQTGTTNHSEREGRARKGLGERAGEREKERERERELV